MIRQKDEKTKTKKTNRRIDKKVKKIIRQRPKREFNLAMSGQFCTLAILVYCLNIIKGGGAFGKNKVIVPFCLQQPQTSLLDV